MQKTRHLDQDQSKSWQNDKSDRRGRQVLSAINPKEEAAKIVINNFQKRKLELFQKVTRVIITQDTVVVQSMYKRKLTHSGKASGKNSSPFLSQSV